MSGSNRKSPMYTVLANIRSGKHSVNGILSNLYCKMLAHLNMEAHTWDLLVDAWAKKEGERIPDPKGETWLKNNTVKALCSDDMTWNVFFRGLRILNGMGRWKKIRFEIHMTPMRGPTELVGLDIIDRTMNKVERTAVYMPVVGAAQELCPDQIVTPGKFYKLTGFRNPRFNRTVLQYIGAMERTVGPGEFDGCTYVGALLMSNEGTASKYWAMSEG